MQYGNIPKTRRLLPILGAVVRSGFENISGTKDSRCRDASIKFVEGPLFQWATITV